MERGLAQGAPFEADAEKKKWVREKKKVRVGESVKKGIGLFGFSSCVVTTSAATIYTP